MKRFSNINDEYDTYKKHKINNIFYDLNNFIYQEVAYEIGTKIGLLKASKNLNNIKIHGIDYLEIFSKEIKENLFNYIQEYDILDKYSLSNNLKDDYCIFLKYNKYILEGFNCTFFKYLQLNLKKYQNIQNYIQLNYY